MKKKFVAMMLALVLALSLMACESKTAESDATVDNLASQTTSPELIRPAATDSIGDHFVGSDYQYDWYGSLCGMESMDGGYWVVAVRAMDQNGEPYVGYDVRTCYLSKDLMAEEPIPFNDHLYRFKMVNDERGGGSINLPSMIVEVEEVSEIPFWGGQ